MHITYKAFKQKYEGKQIDIDGNSGVQCVDGVKIYGVECNKVPNYNTYRGNAKEWFNIKNIENHYEKILPHRNGEIGDIAVFGSPHGNINNVFYGHVGILDLKDTGKDLKIFGQNQGNLKAFSSIYIKRIGLIGFLRPKNLLKDKSKIKTISYLSVAAIAGYLGISQQELVNINPHLSGIESVTPDTYIDLPATYNNNVNNNFFTYEESYQNANIVHVVKPNETLYGIASKYGTNWKNLVSLNKNDIESRTKLAGLPINKNYPLGWWIFPDQILKIK